jgi:hypothetical protein
VFPVKIKDMRMDNVQNCDSYINSSQTFDKYQILSQHILQFCNSLISKWLYIINNDRIERT